MIGWINHPLQFKSIYRLFCTPYCESVSLHHPSKGVNFHTQKDHSLEEIRYQAQVN